MAESTTSSATLQCVVVTPEDTILDVKAKFVVVPLYDGELGIDLGHSPTIGRLGQGELRITDAAGQLTRFFVDGGFVQVADNVVSLLTNRAVPAGELDPDAIQAELATATAEPAAGDEAIGIRQRRVDRSRAQLRIAARAK